MQSIDGPAEGLLNSCQLRTAADLPPTVKTSHLERSLMQVPVFDLRQNATDGDKWVGGFCFEPSRDSRIIDRGHETDELVSSSSRIRCQPKRADTQLVQAVNCLTPRDRFNL
jgi:hypothetical protein